MPMWVDEAESCINALTILQHGVPMGTYLGMPIYENTHIVSWPESSEYRFKDVSYSDSGLAVYHGWMPLYAIAGSLWATGIQPDELTSPPNVRHTLNRSTCERFPASCSLCPVRTGCSGHFLLGGKGFLREGSRAGGRNHCRLVSDAHLCQSTGPLFLGDGDMQRAVRLRDMADCAPAALARLYFGRNRFWNSVSHTRPDVSCRGGDVGSL